jgi:hypothetical protein
MQAFHLIIACGFIYVFNRYAPIKNIYKILFTFGYFPLYEYTMISRSYGLGILILFLLCALYKNRTSWYILIGFLLALLANVTIYTAVIAAAFAVILLLDYFYYQQKDNKKMLRLLAGLMIFIAGVAFSLYQVWPEKDNSFPAPYATQLFDMPRWFQVGSKLFSTYFYIPRMEMNFWNTNVYFNDYITLQNQTFGQWLSENTGYLWGWVIMPILMIAACIIIFLRKPLILLFFLGTTAALFAIYYYTDLIHSRYCGFLLIVLICSYWLAEYYPEKKYFNGFYAFFSKWGKKISNPFIAVILFINVIGAIVAYTMDIQYKFSPSHDVARYIKENKLDSLPVAGITDFTVSPLSTYLDKEIFYLQMNDYGSFTIWNKKRNDKMTYQEWVNCVGAYIDKGNSKILLIKNSAPQISYDGKNSVDMERAIIRNDLQVDLLRKFEAGIVKDEQYYIYLLQKVDPLKVDYSRYIKVD